MKKTTFKEKKKKYIKSIWAYMKRLYSWASAILSGLLKSPLRVRPLKVWA